MFRYTRLLYSLLIQECKNNQTPTSYNNIFHFTMAICDFELFCTFGLRVQRSNFKRLVCTKQRINLLQNSNQFNNLSIAFEYIYFIKLCTFLKVVIFLLSTERIFTNKESITSSCNI